MNVRVFSALVIVALGSIGLAFVAPTPAMADGFTITSQPGDTTLTSGQSLSMSLTATGAPSTMVMQWQRSTDGGTTFTNVGSTAVPSSGSITVTYPSSVVSSTWNGYQFRVRMTDGATTTYTVPLTLTVLNAPIIASQPVSKVVRPSGTATFQVVAYGQTPATIQWQTSKDGGATWVNVGTSSTSVSLPHATSADDCDVRVSITNAWGSVTSDVAHLTVGGAPTASLSMNGLTVADGTSMALMPGAVVPLSATYDAGYPVAAASWQDSTDGGATWNDIPGASGTSYQFTVAASDHGRRVRFAASNSWGSVGVGLALRVGQRPWVSTQPVSTRAAEGTTVSLSSAATGYPTPTVQWQRRAPGGSWSDVAGATDATYAFTFSAADSGVSFRAVHANREGTRVSDAATVTSTADPTSAEPPLIVSQPSDVTTGVGGPERTVARAINVSSAQWQRSTDGGATWTSIPEGNWSYSSATGTGTAEYFPTSSALLTEDGRWYRVRFTGPGGTTTSEPIVVRVSQQLDISAQPADVLTTGTANYSITAAAPTTMKFRWQTSLDSGSTWTDVANATGTTLSQSGLGGATGVQFRAIVYTAGGTLVSRAAAYNYGAMPAGSVSANFGPRPVGSSMPMSAHVSAGTPVPTMQWQVKAPGSTDWVDVVGETGTYYTPLVTEEMHGTQYRVVLSNAWGTTATSAVTLKVGVTPSVAIAGPATALPGTQVTLNITSMGGEPAPTVQWQQRQANGLTWGPIDGATGMSYSFTYDASSSGTAYRALVTNRVDLAISNSVNLYTGVAPSVATQPADKSVTAGTATTFSAKSAGSPIPDYRWEQSTDGGATWTTVSTVTAPTTDTATYKLSPSVLLDGAQFRVVFTNTWGTVTSNSATLRVSAAPTVQSITPATLRLPVTGTASWTAQAFSTVAPTVQWQRSNDGGTTWADVPGATSVTYTSSTATSTYSFAATMADDNAKFRARFTNASGTTASDAVLLRMGLPTVAVTLVQPYYVPGGGAAGAFRVHIDVTGSPAPSIHWEALYPCSCAYDPLYSLGINVDGLQGGGTDFTYTPAANSRYAAYTVDVCNSVGCASGDTLLWGTALRVLQASVASAVSTPDSQVVRSGQQVSLSTVVSGGAPAPTVQWQVQSVADGPFVDVPGATGPSYSFVASAADSGKRFRAVASNMAGSTVGASALVTVDDSAPSAVASVVGGPSTFGISSGPVVVMVTGNDGGSASSSGVASVTYWTSGAAGSVGPVRVDGSLAAIPVSAQGVSSVTYVATDVAGNVSAPRSQAVVIDPRPVVSIAGGTSVLESDYAAQRGVYFQINLSSPAVTDVVVSFYTRDGSANGCTSTSGCDYGKSGSAAAPQTIKVKAGTTQATLGLSVNPDGLVEPDETFDVVLAGVSSNAVLSPQSVGSATIVDADGISDGGKPVLLLTPRNDVVEGDAGYSVGQVLISLSKPLAVPITVTYWSVDGTAHAPGDYRGLVATTVTLPAGSTQRSIDVRINTNTLTDGDRWFMVSNALVSVPSGVDLIQPGNPAEVRILDDDLPL